MEAKGGVEEVDTIVGEEPSVVGSCHTGNVVRRQCKCFTFVIHCNKLLQLLQRIKQVVEVVAWQVVQEKLKLHGVVTLLLAVLSYHTDHLRDEHDYMRVFGPEEQPRSATTIV